MSQLVKEAEIEAVHGVEGGGAASAPTGRAEWGGLLGGKGARWGAKSDKYMPGSSRETEMSPENHLVALQRD